MRVTVVVTGLGGRGADRPHMHHRMADSMNNDGTMDYRQLERPAVLRQHGDAAQANDLDGNKIDYLDIPAFLRRQEEE